MKLIDTIKKRAVKGRRSIEVPEWAVTLWFGPLTPNDLQSVRDRLMDEGKDPEKHRTHERVTLLFAKAENEAGERVFDYGDRIDFMEHVEWAVFQRVMAFLYGSALGDVRTLDDAKKKSAKTEISASTSRSESS